MFKWIINGGLIILSLVFLKLGLLSYAEANSVFKNLYFSNIFYVSNWSVFKLIFLVYFSCTVLLFVLNCIYYKSIFEYISFEKNKMKSFGLILFSEIKQNKFLYITTLIVFLAGLSIRTYQLNRPIRYDEAFTYLEYGRSYIGYISMNYSYPNNHILHSILVRIFTVFLGDELWVIRLPAFLGGIMILIFTFFLGRKWFGLKAGLLALSFIVFSEWLIDYSVNARGYSLQIALFLLVIFLTITKENRAGRSFLIAVLNTIGFWLIPSYLFCLIVLFFLVAVKHGFSSKIFLPFILSILFSFLIYLPVLAYLGADVLFNNSMIQLYDVQNYFQDFYNNIIAIYLKLTPGLGAVKFVIFLTFIGTSFLNKTKFISIGVVFILTLTIAIKGNNVPSRVFIFLIPIAAILFSGGVSDYLNQLKHKIIIPLLLLPFLSWSIYKDKRLDYEIALNDLPELTASLKSKTSVGVISKIPLDYPMRYYLLKNDKLESLWNTFGTDTIYVITNDFYNQDINTSFGDKTKDYHFSEIKRYNYSILHLGVRQ